MSIKKRLTDAALYGFGAAAGQALFDRAKRELLGDDEEEEKELPVDPKVDPKEEAKRAKAAAQEAERLAKERRKARAKLERDVDDELAALKKKMKK